MKAVLAISISVAAFAAAAATFGVRSIAHPDGPLEPSVRNEVDRALDRAESWLRTRPSCTNAVSGDIFATNGLAAGDVAIRLVSMQKGEGWWITPTNSAPTRLAVDILKGL